MDLHIKCLTDYRLRTQHLARHIKRRSVYTQNPTDQIKNSMIGCQEKTAIQKILPGFHG